MSCTNGCLIDYLKLADKKEHIPVAKNMWILLVPLWQAYRAECKMILPMMREGAHSTGTFTNVLHK